MFAGLGIEPAVYNFLFPYVLTMVESKYLDNQKFPAGDFRNQQPSQVKAAAAAAITTTVQLPVF